MASRDAFPEVEPISSPLVVGGSSYWTYVRTSVRTNVRTSVRTNARTSVKTSVKMQFTLLSFIGDNEFVRSPRGLP